MIQLSTALTRCSACSRGTVPGANAPFVRSTRRARDGDAVRCVECHIQQHRAPLTKVMRAQARFSAMRIDGSLRPKSDCLIKLVTPRQMIYKLRAIMLAVCKLCGINRHAISPAIRIRTTSARRGEQEVVSAKFINCPKRAKGGTCFAVDPNPSLPVLACTSMHRVRLEIRCNFGLANITSIAT